MTDSTGPATAGARSSWRPFLPMFAIGMLGVLSLPLATMPVLRQLLERPGAPAIPYALLVALSVLQPAVLLAIAVAIGVRLAPRLALRSHLHDRAALGTPVWPALRGEMPIALVSGAATGVIIVLLDYALAPGLGRTLRVAPEADRWPPADLLVGVLYGGITEELLMRWGLVTLLAWLGTRLVRGPGRRAPAGVMWSAIALAAVLFGVGHLPALAASVSLTPLLVGRTILLNALAGVVFGWLYWRWSLEAAMVAHAGVHVIFALAALTVLV